MKQELVGPGKISARPEVGGGGGGGGGGGSNRSYKATCERLHKTNTSSYQQSLQPPATSDPECTFQPNAVKPPPPTAAAAAKGAAEAPPEGPGQQQQQQPPPRQRKGGGKATAAAAAAPSRGVGAPGGRERGGGERRPLPRRPQPTAPTRDADRPGGVGPRGGAPAAEDLGGVGALRPPEARARRGRDLRRPRQGRARGRRRRRRRRRARRRRGRRPELRGVWRGDGGARIPAVCRRRGVLAPDARR